MVRVRKKKLLNLGTAYFDTLEVAEKDYSVNFYMVVMKTFSPSLTFYQTDVPVIVFLAKNLAELMKVFVILVQHSDNVNN